MKTSKFRTSALVATVAVVLSGMAVRAIAVAHATQQFRRVPLMAFPARPRS